MRNAIITVGATLALSCLLLAGCGQTGPLYPAGESDTDAPQTQTQSPSSAEQSKAANSETSQ
ncbi:MAG: lipoprotein [Proteobacteria bacterium]|nr:lipoprotein [Pseudomonadota bacterium]